MAQGPDLRLELGAPEWRDDLKKIEGAVLADSARGIVIDAAGQSRIGTLAAQLVVAIRRHAAVEKRDCRIENVSDDLRAEVERIGLARALFEEVTP
ncbi:hypothetical protein [Wenxinia saemankumensis]|nr:hypothetical protein [Wenxinia saemankumensis]